MDSVVFKVKYEDTLRRFNVRVFSTEDRTVLEKRLDLNMEGLRLKICSLFNLPSTTCFNLTYIDEDDDLVTLADDEDLHDVLSQCLNPVRITVCMKTDKPIAASAEQSTPKVSSDPNSQQNDNLNVTEVLKTVPVPLRHAFSKITSDLTAKAASTSPILGDLLDGLSKVGQSYLNASPSDGSTTPQKNSPSKKVDASMDRGVKHNDSQTSNIAQLSPKNNESIGKEEFIPSYRQLLMRRGENVNLDEFEKNKYNLKLMEDNKNVYMNSGTDAHVNSLRKCISSENVTSKSAHGVNKSSHFDGGSHSRQYFDLKSVGECPISGELPTFPPLPCEPIYPIQTALRTANEIFQTNVGPNFHKGVRCDGCGVLPITGPRFKSKV
ncbi:unnamed protein product [Amaranthus hypochondriacus]